MTGELNWLQLGSAKGGTPSRRSGQSGADGTRKVGQPNEKKARQYVECLTPTYWLVLLKDRPIEFGEFSLTHSDRGLGVGASHKKSPITSLLQVIAAPAANLDEANAARPHPPPLRGGTFSRAKSAGEGWARRKAREKGALTFVFTSPMSTPGIGRYCPASRASRARARPDWRASGLEGCRHRPARRASP